MNWERAINDGDRVFYVGPDIWLGEGPANPNAADGWVGAGSSAKPQEIRGDEILMPFGPAPDGMWIPKRHLVGWRAFCNRGKPGWI